MRVNEVGRAHLAAAVQLVDVDGVINADNEEEEEEEEEGEEKKLPLLTLMPP